MGPANFTPIEASLSASKIRFISPFKLHVYANGSPGPVGSEIAGVTDVLPTVTNVLD